MTFYYVIRSCDGYLLGAYSSEFEARNEAYNYVDRCFVTTYAPEID